MIAEARSLLTVDAACSRSEHLRGGSEMKIFGVPVSVYGRECYPFLPSKVEINFEKFVREACSRSFPKQRLSDFISNLSFSGK